MTQNGISAQIDAYLPSLHTILWFKCAPTVGTLKVFMLRVDLLIFILFHHLQITNLLSYCLVTLSHFTWSKSTLRLETFRTPTVGAHLNHKIICKECKYASIWADIPIWVISQPKIDGFCFNLAHFKGQKIYIWNHGPDHGQDFGTGYNLGTVWPVRTVTAANPDKNRSSRKTDSQ